MADLTANTTNARTTATVDVEDLAGVRSRVSWGAIAAGSVLALSLYFLLTLLGGAIGLSVSDKFEGRNIGTGAAVYAILVTAVCLFAGGFVAAQMTAGENKREAAMYGLFVWAVVFAMLLWLLASGVKAGFNTMVGVTTAGARVADTAAQNTTQADWETLAQRAGVPAGDITALRDKVKSLPAEARAKLDDPETKRKADEAAREAGEVATRVTWYSFLGALVSMLAAVGGGLAGAGPTFRLFAAPAARPAGSVRSETLVRA